MFNQFVWDLYLNNGGKETAAMFERNLQNEFTDEYVKKICEFHKSYCPSKAVNKTISDKLYTLLDEINNKYDIFCLEEGLYTLAEALDILYDEEIFNGEQSAPKKDFEFFSSWIEYFSTILSMQLPELFVPYYFMCNFNVVERICDEFEIEIPDIPFKKDYEGRFYYYGILCNAFHEFAQKYNMTPYELYAFIYDFAPKYVGGAFYILDEIPEPTSAYFIGGSKDDIFLSKDTDTITPWQCNPDTRAGDMIVMYLKSPISSVDSIWRSVSVGFNDPFFFYYRCTYIAKPQTIKMVSQKKLEKDKVFKELPIVRKNMQGINGVEIRPSEYNHLLDLAKSDLPKMDFAFLDDNSEFQIEKDVENKLIKPFIKKLGYGENDYEPQLHIEIGNHNAMLIPDFVLLPDKKRGQQTAFAIIEAKLKIVSLAELEKVEIQARSYARQILAKYSVIASKDEFRLYPSNNGFYDEAIFVASWQEIEDPDVFSKLHKILGKK